MDTDSRGSGGISGLTGFDQVGLDWPRRLSNDAELSEIIMEINDLREFASAFAKVKPRQAMFVLGCANESERAGHFQHAHGRGISILVILSQNRSK
jgi:hypothetical protein